MFRNEVPAAAWHNGGAEVPDPPRIRTNNPQKRPHLAGEHLDTNAAVKAPAVRDAAAGSPKLLSEYPGQAGALTQVATE